MKPTIYLLRSVAYALDGPVTLQAQFTAENPFAKGELTSTNGPIVLPVQPSPWTTDEQIREAAQKLYPDADVQWIPLLEPVEIVPAPQPVDVAP